ncbi:hypothetical protein Tco_0904418 [Tanacetum coccineum]
MLAIPHLSQVSSMAEIDSKEAQKKSKAGICFRITSHNKHTWLKLSPKKHKLQVQERETSAINRAFFQTKRPPSVTNSVLGLATVTTWKQILNKEFGMKRSKENIGGSSNVRMKGKRKML